MLIAIILLISVGGAFYRLAFDYEKNPWLYVFLGILSFFGTFYLGAFLVALLCALQGKIMDELILTVLAYGIGGLCCGTLYVLLRRNWRKNEKLNKMGNSKILDDQL